MRTSYTSGAIWEDQVGYRRAVRVDNTIEVSGTTSIRDGKMVGQGDAYAQSKCIFEIIQEAIEALGGKMEHVVRTRMYTTDITQWEKIGEAHGHFFKDIKPTTTLVEVKGLIHPDMIVEIEATAIIDE